MSQRDINMQNAGEQPHETNRNMTFGMFSSPMISTVRGGASAFHDRFSPSIVGPHQQIANNMFRTNPNVEPTRPISPLPMSRLPASNLLLNQRVGTEYPASFIPSQSTHHNIAAAALVPPHCNNCPYHNNHNNGNSFQNLSLELTLGMQSYNGDGDSSNVPSAFEVGEGSSSAWQMPPNGFAFSEFAVGESSNAGAYQAAANAIPKRHAGIESPCHCTCLTCPQHGNPGPHHQRGTRLTAAQAEQTARIAEAYRNNALAQSAAAAAANNPQAAAQPNYGMPSNGYMPAGNVQQSSMYQHYYVSTNTNHTETSSFQQDRSVGDYGPSWTSVMWPRTAPSVSPPHWSDVVHSPSGSYMIVPEPNQIGRGNSNINGVHNSNNAHAGGFHGNGRSPYPAFREMSSIARYWMHRLNMHHESFEDVAPSPLYLSDPETLRQDIRNVVNRLRNGGSIQLEELLILDYSIVLNLIDAVTDGMFDDDDDWDDMQYEDLVDVGEQIGNVNVGLSEDQILAHIGQETFVSIAEEEYQNDTCSICQHDYVSGDQIGRLDCRHGYHLECIQHWLMIKNSCPICKQVALAIVADENDGNGE